MAKKGKTPKPPMLSLEEQLRRHDEDPPDGPVMNDRGKGLKLDAPSVERAQWANRRIELVDAIRRRDGKRMRDPGRDASGNFGPSPYAERGHRMETAPREMRDRPESQFPKRLSTQRVVDRLLDRGVISAMEWRAAKALWEAYCGAGEAARLVAAYSPNSVHSTPDPDGLACKRIDAGGHYMALRSMIPARCLGVVIHVVINDWELSAWGLRTVRSERARRQQGEKRISKGLSALARRLKY
ncbi:hypothetical protein UFOVP860_22 [uncultured Caudovirales phage]|uniref:Uncharacterized protein n=1 Tax=uncultured Caudovirales phage TaxID=2100421 RepID=A0A6J5PIK1_9CAUD|nr:hypothetical protein UFOVP860_22 [uncultured Caudovirales phage]CAB4196251.1 hypothetical protein UFOVP1293_89 [uncultured Caudovirales phage]CAB4222321.1 hypothetical protein UFOVP1644_12 [uncultured Caudovirales phage]